MNGKVTKLISDNWTVLLDNKYVICKCIGKFRHLNVRPIVGDIVDVDIKNKLITNVHKRKNELVRPLVANVDQAIILVSCTNPDFSSILLDKMLVVIEYNNIKPIICFTKYDLLNDKTSINNEIAYYKKIGYEVIINSEIKKIKKLIKGKISVLTGQTGVGKSTMLNRLKPDLNLKTNEISKALGRGKHTTRHVELLDIEDGLVADTPGFSSFDFIGMQKKDIKDNFIEFYENQHNCKYDDCMHLKEDGCFIKKMVMEGKIKESRYNNYKKFIESL